MFTSIEVYVILNLQKTLNEVLWVYLVKVINIYDESDEVVLTPTAVGHEEAQSLIEKLEHCLQEPYFVTTALTNGNQVHTLFEGDLIHA